MTKKIYIGGEFKNYGLCIVDITDDLVYKAMWERKLKELLL
jgi:hypothetical protein